MAVVVVVVDPIVDVYVIVGVNNVFAIVVAIVVAVVVVAFVDVAPPTTTNSNAIGFAGVATSVVAADVSANAVACNDVDFVTCRVVVAVAALLLLL